LSKPFTGGCACGAVRYEIAAEPVFQLHCHCRHCQQKSGTGHGSYLAFPSRDSVTLTGEAAHWDVAGDSGNVKTRSFCPTCGSPVYLTSANMPDHFSIHAASLDDPARFKPQMALFAVSAPDWDPVDPTLTRFERMPG
jgi:hypothetical protein